MLMTREISIANIIEKTTSIFFELLSLALSGYFTTLFLSILILNMKKS